MMQEKNAKILIVDDLNENLHAMQVTLAPLQVEIHTATSGNEALAMMLKHEYAVVLLDVQMPGMDGFEAASLMQNNAITRGMPIIFVTAINKEDEHVFKGYDTGAVDYLFKPVNPYILISKVKVFVNLYNKQVECEIILKELHKAKNLESLGLLAGGIAHDFNNILAAIMGNIDLAKLNIDPDQDKTTLHLLENVNKAAIRAKDLTQQLLTFAKGGGPIKALSSIEQVIKESADFVLHGSNVICKYDFASNLWNAEFDTSQVSQVIQNIVINSIQAMPGGGNIEINCQNLVKDDALAIPVKNGKYIKIEISDNGLGIPHKIQEKIFDPYLTTKKNGNGLGLTICHSIIKKHGGHIFAESKQGDGAKFTVFLPATGNKFQAAKEEYISPTKCIPGKILVMDDEIMLRNVTQKMLTQMGHETTLAQDGHEAIQLFQEAQDKGSPIDIVIMDLTIPGGMGGQKTIQEILKINPAAKVIVSSGYANDPIVANYQEYGFCGSIAKPYSLQALQKVIQQFL